MTTLQKTIVTATLIVAAGTGIYEARQNSKLRDQVQTFQQQQVPLEKQMAQFRQELDDTATKLEAAQQENERLRQSAAELPGLRGEVARLRSAQQQLAQSKTAAMDMNDPSIQNFLAFKAKAAEIARYLDQMPDKKIPELQFLADEDWMIAVKAAKFDTDTDIRKTLSTLRSLAKNRLPIDSALSSFTRANNGQLPTDISQLKPYFKSALGDTPVDDAIVDAILERYKLLHTGNLSDLSQGAWIIAEKAPVDNDYDTLAIFGNGFSTSTRP